jgi:hypothetical protein
VYWHVTSDSPLYLSGHRAAVSISWALPQALASAAILVPSSIRLAPPQESDQLPRGPLGVTPFPISIARTVRATLSTGFHDRAPWSAFRLPGSYPVPFWLQRVSLLRWFAFTVDVLPGLKARASTPPDGSAVAPEGPQPFPPRPERRGSSGVLDGSTCLRLRCPWIPAQQALWVRLPESRRLSPLQPVENQSRGWGIGCHLGT